MDKNKLIVNLNLPVASIKPVSNEYFGKQIIDNYRYMENLQDEAVQQWIKAQSEHTNNILNQIPWRSHFLNRMLELDTAIPSKLTSVVRLANGNIFYLKQKAQDNAWKLYLRDDMNSDEVLLVDPEKWSQETGKPHSIYSFKPSWDGKYLAYGISASGTEESFHYVMEIKTLKDIAQPIWGADWGVDWLPDSRSFFYNRRQEMKVGMAALEKFQSREVYLHKIGSENDQDEIILARAMMPLVVLSPTGNPFFFSFSGSDYAVALIMYGVQKEIEIYTTTLTSLVENKPEWQKICDPSDSVTRFDIQGEYIYLLTHNNAPRFKIVKTSLSNPNFDQAETILEESNILIKNLTAASDALYVHATDCGIGKIIRILYGGKVNELRLPFEGAVDFLPYNALENDSRRAGILFKISSWTRPERIYEYCPQTEQVIEIPLQSEWLGLEPQDLVSQEVQVKSHDGTMVPLSIIHKKDIKLDGSNPCWLLGYGAYGSLIEPFYSHPFYAWHEQGGIIAYAHVRGGGINGEEWYRAGFQTTKPNTWKDFIACAEYLIKQQYTSSKKLAGVGSSAGGILIGRAITERPDLFSVAILRVGLLNPIRFEMTPNGVANIPEFGSCRTEEGFKALYEMDAYLHIEDNTHYPAMLIIHGMNDPRCEPWLSIKFTARAQSASISENPILLRMDYEAGHGRGSTKTQTHQEWSDILSFMMWQFDIDSL